MVSWIDRIYVHTCSSASKSSPILQVLTMKMTRASTAWWAALVFPDETSRRAPESLKASTFIDFNPLKVWSPLSWNFEMISTSTLDVLLDSTEPDAEQRPIDVEIISSNFSEFSPKVARVSTWVYAYHNHSNLLRHGGAAVDELCERFLQSNRLADDRQGPIRTTVGFNGKSGT